MDKVSPVGSPNSRRDFLRLGGVSLAASASGLFGVEARATTSGPATADSVIFLFMAGGVTHLESFDPKPEAPEEIRGTLEAISTDIPGVQFGEVMPRMARQLHKITLLRSYSHDINDHFIAQVFTLSGRRVAANQLFSQPNFGSVVSRLLGPRSELPGYIAVPGSTRPGPPDTNLFVSAWLGQQHAPFCTFGEPMQPEFAVKELSLPPETKAARVSDRGRLLDRVDRRLDSLEKSLQAQGMGSLQNSALRMLESPAIRAAFDLCGESDKLRDHYGRTKLGQRCLLARRLIERGARFVMVDYGYDWGEYNNLWDNHCAPGQNQPHISEMAKRPYHLPAVDRGFSALLEDMSDRRLLERTLVVYMTEFGRTPRINSAGGRDHWGPAGCAFLAGGGVRAGQVIGATDHQAAFVRTVPYSPADVIATVYQALGLSAETIVRDQLARPTSIAAEGQAIPGVL